jgi:hypothetical protein
MAPFDAIEPDPQVSDADLDALTADDDGVVDDDFTDPF